MDNYPEPVAAAIRARKPFKTGQLVGSKTPGGSYILTSPALCNDDDRPRDLVLITRLDEVVSLWPTANLAPALAAIA